MDFFCPITGKSQCECERKDAATSSGSMLLVDVKAAIRVLFTDHVVFTNWLILESLPVLSRGSAAVVKRLLENPKDIGRLLSPILGNEIADDVKERFTEHLVLANNALTAVREGSDVDAAINKFYAQGDDLAASLSNINQNKLPLEDAIEMVSVHNHHVTSLATLRMKGDYKEYVKEYDVYYKHMLMFSDTLYNSLTI